MWLCCSCFLSSEVLELLCLCVCPVEDWNVDCGYKEALHSNVEDWDKNCGYEEALHSNGEVLVLPVAGDQIGQGIKCQLVKDC